MVLRAVLYVFLAIGFVGCATMKKDTVSNEQLEMRISDLERKVEEKDGQIQTLEAKLEETHRTTEVRAARRSTGRAGTKEVQAALKNAGFYTGNVDGKMGKMTKSAIIEFQKANQLKADGVVGQQTWTKLSEHAE